MKKTTLKIWLENDWVPLMPETDSRVVHMGETGKSLELWAQEHSEVFANHTTEFAAFKETMGQPGGIATLNESGQIPSTQLPSYVDDVIEGWLDEFGFATFDETHPSPEYITPTSGKIYIDINTGLSYRWASTSQKFIPISSPVELGTGVEQAYPGNLGQANADAIASIKADYIKSTDYATSNKAGVLKIDSYGLAVNNNGVLYIKGVGTSDIDNRNDVNLTNSLWNAVQPSMIDYAVLSALTTNSLTPTNAQLQAFYKWIGAVQYYYEARNGIARFINGNLIVSTPTEGGHATNKTWVEQHVAAETKIIREALDLAEITETVEVTDKYNSRQTANGLTLYPNQPTTLLKVEGDTITTINRLDLSSVNNSILEITENGKKITAIANGSYMSSQIGVLQDLCPTIHIGDVVYLYCKDGTSVLPNGFVDANNNVVIPVNTATTITAEMLATTVHLGVIPFVQGFVIEDLQITKVQNAPWTPYFEGLKSAEFAGVEITGKNLFNPNRTEYPDKTWLSPEMQRDLSKPYIFAGIAASGYYSAPNVSAQYTNGVLEFTTNGGGYGVGFNIPCTPNQKYTIIFKNLGDIVPVINVSFYKNGVCIGYQPTHNSTMVGATPQDCEQIMVVFSNHAAATIKITDIQVQIGTTATEYTPYIEPTKYAFPNTVNPLGRTIDFENKKIVDYGITVELDGTENWNYYTAKGSFVNNSGNGVVLDGFIPVSVGNVRRLPGIATDGTVEIETDITSDTGFQAGKIWLGIDGRGLYWTGILDMLGFTTKGVEPTDDEKATAIDQFKAYLAQRADVNPVIVRYVAPSVQSETPFTEAQTAAGDSYLPYTGGTETVDNANAEYGVENNITQEYDIVNKIGG